MLVECWHWRFRDPVTWELQTAQCSMTADEVAAFPGAKGIRSPPIAARLKSLPRALPLLE